MARTLTKEEISRLPVWDSLSPAEIPLPESHRHALEEALEEYARDPDAGQDWETVRDELFRKK